MQEDQSQQPGQVVTPGGAPQPVAQTIPPQSVEPQPAPQQQSTPPQPVAQQQVAPQPTPPVQQPPVQEAPTAVTPQEQPSLYNPEFEEVPQQLGSQETVSWTASEYIAHDKDLAWYATLGLVAILVAALLYFITRDFVAPGVTLFGAFMLGFYGARKPRQMTYEVDNQGLTIGEKHFSYTDFKKFALVPEGAFSSIRFVPHKRFSPAITIYYGPEEEDKIVGVLSGHLPIEEHKIDSVDRLMRRIRF